MLELPAPDAITALDAAELAAVLAFLADLEQLQRDNTAARLHAVTATLTVEEHCCLAAEAAAGDPLAELVIAVLAPTATTEWR
jgi:hypothetical protein